MKPLRLTVLGSGAVSLCNGIAMVANDALAGLVRAREHGRSPLTAPWGPR